MDFTNDLEFDLFIDIALYGCHGNEGVFHIPQTSPSDCLVSYPGNSLEGSNNQEKNVPQTTKKNKSISSLGWKVKCHE